MSELRTNRIVPRDGLTSGTFGGIIQVVQTVKQAYQTININNEDDIITAIQTYEPRAEVLNVNTVLNPDNHEVRATVTFKVISTQEQQSVDISLTRLR